MIIKFCNSDRVALYTGHPQSAADLHPHLPPIPDHVQRGDEHDELLPHARPLQGPAGEPALHHLHHDSVQRQIPPAPTQPSLHSQPLLANNWQNIFISSWNPNSWLTFQYDGTGGINQRSSCPPSAAPALPALPPCLPVHLHCPAKVQEAQHHRLEEGLQQRSYHPKRRPGLPRLRAERPQAETGWVQLPLYYLRHYQH